MKRVDDQQWILGNGWKVGKGSMGPQFFFFSAITSRREDEMNLGRNR